MKYRIRKLRKLLVSILLPKSIKLQSLRRLYTISSEFVKNLRKFHSICGKRLKNRKINNHQKSRAKAWATPRTISTRMGTMRLKLWKSVNQSLGILVWTGGWLPIMCSVWPMQMLEDNLRSPRTSWIKRECQIYKRLADKFHRLESDLDICNMFIILYLNLNFF